MRDLMLSHPFGRREIRKLMVLTTLLLMSSGERVSTATPVPNQGNFFVLNLTVFWSSSTFFLRESLSPSWIGSLLIDPSGFPTSLMTFLFKLAEARRVSNFLAHFRRPFFSLARTVRASMSMYSSPFSMASVLWLTLAMMQTYRVRSW